MNVGDVMIAVPTRGNPWYQTVMQLEAIRDRNPGLRPIEYVEGRYSVVLTRNAVLERFVASDAQVLVSVDDDVIPNGRFLEALSAFEQYGMIGWPAPQSGLPWTWSFLPEGNEPGPVVPCVHVGGPMVGIRRDVAEAVRFREGPLLDAKDARIMFPSEDFLYCWDARDAGFEVGCDVAHPADHMQHLSSFVAMYGPGAGHHGLFDVAGPLSRPDDLKDLIERHRVREPVPA